LLDEPTTGLHFDDVRKLLEVLHRLADLGNSVIIIEHNLDVIRNADWILDLGPEGGEDGGRLVAEGRPAQVAAIPASYTGQFLRRYYTSADGKLAPLDVEEEVSSESPASLPASGFVADGIDEDESVIDDPLSEGSDEPAADRKAAAKKSAKRSIKTTRAPSSAVASAKKTSSKPAPRRKKPVLP
jgi:excinuclease ABC subunit A